MVISFLKKHRSRFMAFFGWVVVIILVYYYMISHDYTWLDLVKKLYVLIADTWYGPFVFILAYMIRPILLIPASILYVLSGIIYGFWGGFLFTLIGASISSLIAFAIGRFFAKDFQFDGKHQFIHRWQEEVKENGFFAVLIMRLIYMPFDVVNYGSAILNVNWKPFLLATALSMIVDTSGFISFGATLNNVESFDLSKIKIETSQLMISIALVIMSLMVAVVVHNHHKKKKKLNQQSSLSNLVP